MKMHWGFWFTFCLHWRVVSFFYLYFCADEPQNVSKRMRLFSIYRKRKEKKNWEINQTLFTVFNLKVVLELFHLLFCSSEVLLLLIPSPSGEALMKNGHQHVFFFMHIPGPFFCLHLSFFLFFSLLSSLFSFQFFNNFFLKIIFSISFSILLSFLWDCLFLFTFFWFIHRVSPVNVFNCLQLPLGSLCCSQDLCDICSSPRALTPTFWRKNQTWRKVPALQINQVATCGRRMLELTPGLPASMSIRPW